MNKKKLLIYAHYYYPDVASTGQLLKEQAEGMISHFDITIICVVPSYTGTIDDKYKNKKLYKENINGVNVIRVPIPEFDKSDKLSRVKNILTYFYRAIQATNVLDDFDYVYTISQPPILGGMLGVIGKRIKKAKLIYCIQDFNPEQIIATGYSKSKLIISFMLWLDKRTCCKSDLVVTVGRDLVDTLEKRFVGNRCPKHVMINNWIDEHEIYPLKKSNQQVEEFKKKYGLNEKYIIMYSGNIGLYYDLENLMKVIKKFPKGTITADGREVVFAFVGAGSILDKLKEYTNEEQMEQVVFVPYQDKADLNYSLNAGDVHWCVNAKGIKGVSVPSKLYGIMAAGKPVLGVMEQDAEARIIVEETKCGYVCEPCDYKSVEDQIKKFIENSDSDMISNMGPNGRNYLVNHLTKDVSVSKYIDEILSC